MSIVEKMERAMVAKRMEHIVDPIGRLWPEIARAALTATGLTEAQLEGLANGELVVVPVEATEAMRIAGSQMMVNVYSGGEYGYGRVAAHDGAPGDVGTIYRAMLAAKEG